MLTHTIQEGKVLDGSAGSAGSKGLDYFVQIKSFEVLTYVIASLSWFTHTAANMEYPISIYVYCYRMSLWPIHLRAYYSRDYLNLEVLKCLEKWQSLML